MDNISRPKTIYLKDYIPPDYRIETVDLRFELGAADTTVHSRLRLIRNGIHQRPLILDGRHLQLLRLRLDGMELTAGQYQIDEEYLALEHIPESFELQIVTRIHPQDNTALEGLYTSGGNFCTQCEAEGFRRITYFLDRPDVMAVYTTTVVADKSRYPVLLSNGNRVDQGELADGRHWATWHDPFKKPTYLFALVAGRLQSLEDYFITRSGRRVELFIYVKPEHIDQCRHAMVSLKKAMRWDEEVFGLEYDLDTYMIVAVEDFNMGAMENKGLNIFNTRYVLAKPETATDDDYSAVEQVIGHEYFHNWTGNRVTCRDWFQLSLKEGLTVFRDQEFSADMGSRGVKRIDDVRILRSSQFSQDAGPMAHPVRPESYMEINNFYTLTVYNKGAEVVRMIHTLLGKTGFRKGMDLYIKRHDGQAVTCDDFVAAMSDANGIDLAQFRRWYAQAGTPELTVSDSYDSAAHSYTLKVRQSCPATPGQAHKKPFHIPLAVGLLDATGAALSLQLEGEETVSTGTRILEIKEPEQHFRFVNVPSAPIPSLLREFSAPVKLRMDYTDEDLMFLLAHDKDDFNRWEASQILATRTVLKFLENRHQDRSWALPAAFTDAFDKTLKDPGLDPALLARILILPSEGYLAEQMTVVDVDGIHQARNFLRQNLAQSLADRLLTIYHANIEAYTLNAEAMGRRSLKNRCLDYLLELDDPAMLELCLAQLRNADNMNDELGALAPLSNRNCPERGEALSAFYQRWRLEPLVVDKWFTLQATSRLPNTFSEVNALMTHEAFTIKNPNKVRALIGAFCQANPVRFHASNGAGYVFLADQVLALDTLNPQIAARLLGGLTRWRRYDQDRQQKMKEQLERILAAPDLSPDVYEIASKSLRK